MLLKTILNNKAQGLQISTVILAVLGILVLFLLIGIVTGKIGWFGKGLEEAAEQECPANNVKTLIEPCPPNTQQIYGKFKTKNAAGTFTSLSVGQKCCM